MEPIMRKDPLRPIRFAIHGWSFCDDDTIAAMLQQAEKQIAGLPQAYQSAAQDIVAPLRRQLNKRHM